MSQNEARMIEFLCPEGHRIRCPKEKAGRPAKCPKCGVGFRIPTIEELGLGESTVADSSLAGEEVAEAPAAPPPSPSGVGKQSAVSSSPTKERQIEFLCPNGHHLHGPASLQGRAGECPECGSRFRIPVINDPEADPKPLVEPEATTEPEIPAEEEITLENPMPLAEPEQVKTPEAMDSFQILDDNGSGLAGKPGASGEMGGAILALPSGVNGAQPGTHPLAALFIELWAARDEGSRVEVHLESGSVLLPDGYLKSHSQRDFAVLVARDPDGLSTVTVVPWNSISRIILRAVKQVPGEVVR
jgi:hypothetical protein